MDALEQLKQVLLYKEIAKVNGDVLFFKRWNKSRVLHVW